MTPFRDWLARVLTHGESVQLEPPPDPAGDRAAALDLLREAFDRAALDVAGTPVPFDPDAALAAAAALARACWLLVAPDEGEPAALPVAAEPSTASAHLSVDVTFRLLPAVYRRAALRDPGAGLAAEVERLLRAWPLSGVLADLNGGPTTPPDFGGHPGLQLLYAERLVRTARPGWVPPSGPAREWAERVFAGRGRPLPHELPPEDPARG
jgi:hypothetical protein